MSKKLLMTVRRQPRGALKRSTFLGVIANITHCHLYHALVRRLTGVKEGPERNIPGFDNVPSPLFGEADINQQVTTIC